MAPASAESRSKRARLAHRTRQYGVDSPQAQEARRDFAAARLEDYVRETVASAPPLTQEQRARIASLLRVNTDRLADAIGGDLG